MRILVLTAFHDEARSFMSTLLKFEKIVLGKRKCFYGQIEDHEVYVSFSGIGTTSAAATTTALCERLNPDCIFMCGSAGGLIAGQKTGDLIIGESVIDIDLYTLPKALQGSPYEPCLTDPHLEKALEFEFKSHPLFLSICESTELADVSKGKIVTSNTFPAPPEAFKTITELGCHVIEMESTGVFNAAKHYNIPVMVVRAISNSLDDTGKDLGTPTSALSICSNRISDFLRDLMKKIHQLQPLINEKNNSHIDLLVIESMNKEGFALEYRTKEIFEKSGFCLDKVDVTDGDIDVFAYPSKNSCNNSIFVVQCKGSSSENFLCLYDETNNYINSNKDGRPFGLFQKEAKNHAQCLYKQPGRLVFDKSKGALFYKYSYQFIVRQEYLDESVGETDGRLLWCCNGDFVKKGNERIIKIKNDDKNNLYKGCTQLTQAMPELKNKISEVTHNNEIYVYPIIVTNAEIKILHDGKDLIDSKWAIYEAKETNNEEKIKYIFIVNLRYLDKFLKEYEISNDQLNTENV